MSNFIQQNISSLSLLIFLSFFHLGQMLDIIPSNQAIFTTASELYLSAPIALLVVGTFLSSVAFINLYTPGPIIILAAILSSSGTLREFFLIASVVSMTAMASCLISFYWGEKQSAHNQQLSTGSWLLGHSSLYTLGFWYYYAKLKPVDLVRYLIGTGLFLFPYSIIICYLLYPTKSAINENTNLYLIGIILIYLGYKLYRDRFVSKGV